MIILVATFVKDQIFPPISQAFSAVPAAQTALTSVSASFSIFDYLFLFVFIGMMITPIILSFLTPSHPILIFVNIILLIVYILIVPSLSNVMGSFWSQTAFAPYAAGGSASTTFPIMTALFEWLPLISCGFAFVLMVVMFSKQRGEV